MSQTTAQIAFDPNASPEERFDAQAELQKSHTNLAGLLPSAEVQPVIDYILNDLRDQEMMAKAGGGVVVPFPSKNAGKKGMQSVVVDDLQISIMGDYIERPGLLDFRAQRSLVDQTPVLSAVMLTRIRQVQAFCRRQESGHGVGFTVRHADLTHQLSQSERETTELMNRFFVNCGWEFNPRRRKRMGRDSLRQFMAKSVRDSLSMDSAPIETEFKKNRALGIDGFYAVDGSTIRLCSEDGYKGDDEIFALQVVQGQIRTAYDYNSLIYEPRNPRADVLTAGYGLSETELLIKVVTGFLNAMTLNIRGFSDNAIPKGVLHLSGNYGEADLNAFKRYWNAMVKGVNNTWAVPVLVSKDQDSRATFENFNIDFNEMYFSKWMTFLTSIICAVYGIAPDEINFESFSASRSSLSGSDTAERLADSKDKGLRPLLSYYESLFSDYILAEFGDSYVFRWTGIDEDDQDKRHELKKLTLNVNEVRAEQGYEPITEEWGAAPLNPSLIGAWQNSLQQKQQGGDFGAPQDAPKPGQGDGPEGVGSGGGEQPMDEDQGAGEDPEGLQKANPNHDRLGRFSKVAHQIHREKKELSDLYDFTLNNPLAAPDSMLVMMDKDDLNIQIEHGPAVESANGEISVSGEALKKQYGTDKGIGMVKVIWRHGEKSDKPSYEKVTKNDVLALPEVIRSTPTQIVQDANGQPVRWEWARKRHDGETVYYAASRFSLTDSKNHVVSVFVLGDDGEMKKSDSNPGEDLYGPMRRIPASGLSVATDAVEPLTAYYATPGLEVKDSLEKAAQHGVGVDDEVFFNHGEHGICSGKVLAYGKDGFTAEHPEAGSVGVPWAGFLGHKKRADRSFRTVESGDGGTIVEDTATGERHFLSGDLPDGADPELDDEIATVVGDDSLKKSDTGVIERTVYVPNIEQQEALNRVTDQLESLAKSVSALVQSGQSEQQAAQLIKISEAVVAVGEKLSAIEPSSADLAKALTAIAEPRPMEINLKMEMPEKGPKTQTIKRNPDGTMTVVTNDGD